MDGHPFGLTASVFNFNRRAVALTSFVVRDLRLVALSYYDDSFGLTGCELAQKECDMVAEICKLLGVAVSPNSQAGQAVVLLGISFLFKEKKLAIDYQRKEKVLAEIWDVLASDSLPPGQAEKLKGKLQFICGHFTSRHGRAFLRPLAERQYASNRSSSLPSSLHRALQVWIMIITSEAGTHNFLDASEAVPSDVVLSTDGSFPDAHRGEKWEDFPPRIGWTAFIRGATPRWDRVIFSSMVVTPAMMMEEWLPRSTQVCLVELLGAVAAIDYLEPLYPRQRLLVLIDSEAVEAAVIKGSGAKEDMCDLIAVFSTSFSSMTCWFTWGVCPPTPRQPMGKAVGPTKTSRPAEPSGST